ncbi:hypothetical protein JVU11DRAFT_10719 [Chiua virens]|nr:hypothetical protein JVU11DRAFT_10719 [Chiua virens]
MQYNHYSPSPPQGSVPHPSQSPDEYAASPYSDLSHHHSTLAYATVNSASHMPAGSIAQQSVSAQYPYSTYSPDDHRSYYTTSSQGHAVEHYPTSSSPPNSYATSNPSGHISQTSRHQPHLSQSQQQFIPTPSQAYQVYSSAGSTSSPRSRSSVEPYYHMSPNPQHVVHPSASTTHATSGTGGRSNTAAHGTGSSHSSHHPHVTSTLTGTIVVAAGERYPCHLCERSFTRLHDRRRHYETVHATSPVLHKCRFCRKDFSRADSLKRHVDNGCDECRDRV